MLSREFSKKLNMKIPYDEDPQLVVLDEASALFKQHTHQDLMAIEDYYAVDGNKEKQTDRPVVSAKDIDSIKAVVPSSVHFYVVRADMIQKLIDNDKPWNFFKKDKKKSRSNKDNNDEPVGEIDSKGGE